MQEYDHDHDRARARHAGAAGIGIPRGNCPAGPPIEEGEHEQHAGQSELQRNFDIVVMRVVGIFADVRIRASSVGSNRRRLRARSPRGSAADALDRVAARVPRLAGADVSSSDRASRLTGPATAKPGKQKMAPSAASQRPPIRPWATRRR